MWNLIYAMIAFLEFPTILKSHVLVCIGHVAMFFPLQKIQRFQFLNSPKQAKRGHEKKILHFFKIPIFLFQCLNYHFFQFLMIYPQKIEPNLTNFPPFLSFSLPYLCTFQMQKSP